MTLFTTGVSDLDRWYVSNTKEATIGTAQTRDRSFFAVKNDVKMQAEEIRRPGVNGRLNATEHVRVKKFSGGTISDNVYPAVVNWAMRYLFHAAPTTAAVAPSTTVYSHTWNTIGAPPWTFTMTKQHAGSMVIETLCGLCITEVTFKSTDGVGSIEIKVDGTGQNWDTAASEPSVTPLATADQEVMVGVNTTCLIDDTEVSAGLFVPTWEVKIKNGAGRVPSAGSTEGAYTRIDKTGRREVTAKLTLYVTDATLWNDFKNKTVHDYKFKFFGPEIDDPNNLKALVQLHLPAARNIGSIESGIGDFKVKEVPLNVEALIATSGAGSGYDVIVTTYDLQHSTTV